MEMCFYDGIHCIGNLMSFRPRPSVDENTANLLQQSFDDLSEMMSISDQLPEKLWNCSRGKHFENLYDAIEGCETWLLDEYMYDPEDTEDPDFEVEILHPKGWMTTMRRRYYGWD